MSGETYWTYKAASETPSYAAAVATGAIYAARIESGFAPRGNNLAALHLESVARAGREYLADMAAQAAVEGIAAA